jgi:hypothetical protein
MKHENGTGTGQRPARAAILRTGTVQKRSIMKNVISISRRTDIPRFYLKWLFETLQCGEVTYEHPVAGKRTVSLRPEDVHTLVFWSKDYGPFLESHKLREYLKLYSVYFHFSITGLGGSFLEPLVPGHEITLAQMDELARIWGPERIEWRFDPIVHWEINGRVYSNVADFKRLAPVIRRIGVTKCTFSFATLYGKALLRARKYRFRYIDPSDEEKISILREMVAIAYSLGITLYSCAAFKWADLEGVHNARCIDADLLTRLRHDHKPAPSGKDWSQRTECLCTPSIDIGSYKQGCPHGCLYCYANPIIPDRLVRSLLS